MDYVHEVTKSALRLEGSVCWEGFMEQFSLLL